MQLRRIIPEHSRQIDKYIFVVWRFWVSGFSPPQCGQLLLLQYGHHNKYCHIIGCCRRSIDTRLQLFIPQSFQSPAIFAGVVV